MKKATATHSSFRTRSANFSTHGKQNGLVETLPPEAEEFWLAAKNLLEQRESLKQSLISLQKNNPNLTSDERHERAENIRRAQSQVKDLSRTITLAKETNHAWVFYRVARHLMPQDIFKTIDMEAERVFEISGRTPPTREKI